MGRTILDIATVAERCRQKMVQFLKENESRIYKLEQVPSLKENAANELYCSEYIFDMFYIGPYRYFCEWVDFTRGLGENNVHSLTVKFNFEVAGKDVCIYFFTSETFNDIDKKIKERIISAIKEEKEFIEEAEKIIQF